MAYTSRKWQKQWTYDPEGNDFTARVGRILAGCAVLNGTNRINTPSAQSGGGERNATQSHPSTANAGGGVGTSHAGYALVDNQGRVLDSGEQLQTHRPNTVCGDVADTRGQKPSPLDRSMRLWTKLLPSYLPQQFPAPFTTTQDHFQWQPKLVEPTNKRHHLKKTDFSEYTEVSLKQMKHLKHVK